jgi:hypothetical protein
MTLIKVLSISMCMGVGAQAFATDPPNSAPPAATTATAPPATATESATADAASTAAADKAKTAATAAKTATPPNGVTPDQAKTLRGAGYKSEVRNGVTSYCHSETQIGSRFDKQVCGSPDEILRRIAASQELVNQMQHTTINSSPIR